MRLNNNNNSNYKVFKEAIYHILYVTKMYFFAMKKHMIALV